MMGNSTLLSVHATLRLSSLDPTFLCSQSILFYKNFADRSFLHPWSKTQLPSQNVSLRS